MLLLHNNSHVDVLIRDDPLQHRRILRISKSKKMCHSIDRDVIISSTDLATSTAFIHNIPRLRQPEQEQISIFKLVFHHWKTAVSKNSPKRTSIKRFAKINSFCMTLRIQKSETSWQNEMLVLHNSEILLFPILLLVPRFFMYHLALICKKPMPTSSNFRRVLNMVRQEQIHFQKRVLMYCNEFCATYCKQESRLIIPLGLGILIN